ncbi:hypothetical protein TorRG33x02_236190 [Trema orientale]|uniref:DUF7870 domain-containing protein n=1 Tax=Trema orientale TaxID=63057 RepID=A0A2P5E1F5_TREOI|nr:hypothetical protein TorRG33x02_236190 [Trema orientale]
MAIGLVRSFRTKRGVNYHKYFKNYYNKSSFGAGLIGLYGPKLPKYSSAFKLLARFMVLAILLATVSFGTGSNLFTRLPSSILDGVGSSQQVNVKALTFLFRDLTSEGLVKASQKAIFVMSAADANDAIALSQIINDNKIEAFSTEEYAKRQSSIPDDSLGFAFVPNFPTASEFIDLKIRLKGVVAFQLKEEEHHYLTQKPSNYEIVYLRRFNNEFNSATIHVAMRKTGHVSDGRRRLLGFGADAQAAKKAALEKLEDVLLEPPRAASGRSSRYSKRTRFLPDLMGDSLENYPRRVFIDVGLEGGVGSGRWFAENYPMRDKEFEMYRIEATSSEEMGISEWMEENLREEEYVVMKAEAEAVEEIMVKSSKAIRLVDELFLDCKPNKNQLGRKAQNVGNRRWAYWECLALYGRLRDEGVAVHQWWG